MRKKLKDLNEIKMYLREFASVRNWEQFHSPKNLSMALSVEVAELVEHFQWLTEEQSGELSEEKKANVAEELADIQLYLVRLADQLNIDILQAVDIKTRINEKRYPAEKVRGSAKKYNEYDEL